MINKKSIEIYNLSDDREKRLWQDCIFVFDTSALLEFYFYSDQEWQSISESIFTKLIGRLWIPQQVEYEYLKNKEETSRKPIKNYKYLIESEKNNNGNNENSEKQKLNNDSGYLNNIDQSVKKINQLVEEEINKISGQFKALKEKTAKEDKHPYFEDKTFIEEFETVIEDLKKSLNNQINNFKTDLESFVNKIKNEIKQKEIKIDKITQNDPVFEIFNQYFEVGERYSFDELMEIVKEGELRYRSKIPPGYADKDDKKGLSIYGDLILWKQIIDHAKTVKKPVILIINDIKEDWCYKNKRDRIEKPREELIREMYDLTGMEIWMYTFSNFLYKSRQILKTEVDDKVLENIQEIEKELLKEKEDKSINAAEMLGKIGNNKDTNSFISLLLRGEDYKMPSYHHPQEQDYWREEVEVENSIGLRQTIKTNLLRVYPETFNSCDAYMDIPMSINQDIQKVTSPRLNKTWGVIAKPRESPINGYFRGDFTYNNPPARVFGLYLIQE
ncbi:MAG TPA: PIN-like domain-containing protein [Leptolyngbyaceae cyanobacterium]